MPDIEFQALSRAVQDRDFDALALAGITTTFFLDPDNAAIFDWMREHWNKYGSSPSEHAFYQEYPHDSLEEAPEPLAYYIDELRDQRRAAMLQDTLDSIREPLKNQDTDIAIKLLGLGLDGIHQEVTELLPGHDHDQGTTGLAYRVPEHGPRHGWHTEGSVDHPGRQPQGEEEHAAHVHVHRCP